MGTSHQGGNTSFPKFPIQAQLWTMRHLVGGGGGGGGGGVSEGSGIYFVFCFHFEQAYFVKFNDLLFSFLYSCLFCL